MFEHLAKYNRIFVTGPHRAGTRICAKMIVHDTGHAYIDELDIKMDSLHLLSHHFHDSSRFVVQCPSLCRNVHMLAASDESCAIMMRRNIADVVASQNRIGWGGEPIELLRYDRTDGTIAEVKYEFWERTQKAAIPNPFEIDYESLAGHPLWVPQELRQNFLATQTVVRVKGRPRRSSQVYWQEQTESDTLMLIAMNGPIREVNGTGRLIWQLCDGTRTLSDIQAVLKETFDDVSDDTLARDLNEFISYMLKNGFLRWVDSPKNS